MKFFTLLSLLLVPTIMLGTGMSWKNHPPRKINGLYGYRTRRSSSSQAAWDFAHACCGALWRRWGGVMSVVTVAACALIWRQSWFYEAVFALSMAQCAVLLLSILPVERALRAKFDEHGNPKE